MIFPFGLNILAQFLYNLTALLTWIGQAKPASLLVMDGHDVAQAAKRASKDTLVIHRAFNPNDPHWHDRKSDGSWVFPPVQWLDDHAPYAANGVLLAVFNEPSPGDIGKFIDWLIELMALAQPRGIKLVVGNFAVGTPFEKDIEAGVYDRLIIAIVRYGMYLGLHEYFYDNPLTEFPWLCGRFTYWLDRAAVLGLKLKIIVTEHGRDVGGGQNDGWDKTGWGELGYYVRLVMAQTLYKKYGIPVCIFGYGYGAGNRWISFDVQQATTLLAKLIEYGVLNPLMSTIPAVTYPSIESQGVLTLGTVIYANGTINVRNVPSTQGSTVRDLLRQGDTVVYRLGKPYANDGHEWTVIDRINGASVKGWVSELAVIRPYIEGSVAVDLDVPYFDQTVAGATLTANDCGPTVARMGLGHIFRGNKLLDPTLITVDDMTRKTALPSKDAQGYGLTLQEVVDLLRGFGVPVVLRSDLATEVIAGLVDSQRWVIALINDKYLYQGIPTTLVKSYGGHYILIKGVLAKDGKITGFIFHDPLVLKADQRISADQLTIAMSDVSAFANAPLQGVTLM